MRNFLLSCLICLIPLITYSQRWKVFRYELIYGLGVSNFLGELGGANQIGTNYFKDLEFSQTRFATSVGLRYKLGEYFAVKTGFLYGEIRGDDKLTEEFFRKNRNLHFKSPIYEFSTTIEASFMKEQVGHRYRLRGIRGQKAFGLYTYVFAGIGAFYFNPKAQLNGKWVDLQPLGTEGQGLVPTRRKYSLIQMCIPVGIGFKYTLNRQLGFGIEYGLRKTFTDYLDDVSLTYFDNDKIRDMYGPDAAGLADPSEIKTPITSAGQQRGDPRDNDSYMFLVISVNYKLRTAKNNLPKF